MKNGIILFFTILCLHANAQTVIEGRTVANLGRKPLPFTIVMVKINNELITGTEADENGYFKIKIEENIERFDLVLTQIVYEQTVIPIAVSELDTMNKDFIVGKVFKEEEYLFTAKDAKKDIENGVIQLYFYGFPLISPDTMLKIIEKNGLEYTIKYLGCDINQNIVESVEQYNAYVEQYLAERYGVDWEKGVKNDCAAYLKKKN